MPGLQSGELIFRGEDDRCALIGASPSEVIMRHRQLVLDQPEAGGLLIGYLRGRYIEVTMATGPMEGDKRKRMSFLRRDRGHFMIANQLWEESNHLCGYVGEWHTHPEPDPAPSSIDTCQWSAIMKEDRLPRLFVIAGTRSWHVVLATGAPNTRWLPLYNGDDVFALRHD